MPRPTVYDELLRARLVAATADAIAEAGVTGVSLRALARQVGTSTNAVYTMFGSKEALVDAVVDEARDGFTEAQEGVVHTDDALADLFGLGLAYRGWVLANPGLYAVLMGGRVAARDELVGAGWTSDKTVQPLLGAVQRVIDEGLLTSDDPVQVAVTLWAGVHGLVSLEVALWRSLPMAERDRMFEEHVFSLGCRWM